MTKYIPILKWRQGEYQALLRLADDIKSEILPLIEIPPIEWDFELNRLAKSLDDHLEKVPKRLHAKWGDLPILVDLPYIRNDERLHNGSHPVEYLWAQFEMLGISATPVLSLNRDQQYFEAVRKYAKLSNQGTCVRVKFRDLASSSLVQMLNGVLSNLDENPDDVGLVIDLGAPNYQPSHQFALALDKALANVPYLNDWSFFALAGTSFPSTMGTVEKGLSKIARREAVFFDFFIDNTSLSRLPLFSDYAIAHTELPTGDMRLLKPAANVRYTIKNAWLIAKGTSVRDDGFSQFQKLCQNITECPEFRGRNFSSGDRYIARCAEGKQGTGNMTTWRWVGTNHHITEVVSNLSNKTSP